MESISARLQRSNIMQPSSTRITRSRCRTIHWIQITMLKTLSIFRLGRLLIKISRERYAAGCLFHGNYRTELRQIILLSYFLIITAVHGRLRRRYMVWSANSTRNHLPSIWSRLLLSLNSGSLPVLSLARWPQASMSCRRMSRL